jgi:hypothetical protein
MSRLSPRRLRRWAAAASAAALLSCSPSSPQGPSRLAASRAATALPGGTSLDVTLTTPADGALIASPPGDVRLTGAVALGEGAPLANTLLVYALEASPAASGAASCGESATTILACERQAFHALDAAAAASGVVAQVGAVVFSGGAAALDVGPADGAQPLTGPSTDANQAGGPDVLEALDSASSGGATKFSAVTIATTAASYATALQAALGVAAASTLPTKAIVLVAASPNGAGPAVSSLVVPAGVAIHAFALGTTCAAASAFGTLADLAALGAPGSGCVDVAAASELADRVAAIMSAKVDAVALTVDGGPEQALATTPPVPATAPATLTFDATVPALAPGFHELCVVAHGADVGGPAAAPASACARVTVATLALAPASATHELGTPGQTATVTATVAAGATGVPGVAVAFAIASGPNAGRGATVTTGANGEAAFTYPARQHLEGLGTDAIRACFTDAEGRDACADATVTWQDTTPPAMACLPGPNPSGRIVPWLRPASAAGFMTLSAVDAVDPAPLLWLRDTGTGTTWGPFPSGTPVKYTQAPGAKPGAKEMGSDEGGGIEILHVTGTGDPAIVGRDAVGNASEPLPCAVPPWRK